MGSCRTAATGAAAVAGGMAMASAALAQEGVSLGLSEQDCSADVRLGSNRSSHVKSLQTRPYLSTSKEVFPLEHEFSLDSVVECELGSTPTVWTHCWCNPQLGASSLPTLHVFCRVGLWGD